MGRPKKSESKTTKNVKAVGGVLNEKEKEEYRKLTDYIQLVYNNIGLDPPWALFMTQIKDIKKNYNINYTNILHIIQYMIQVENIDITDRDTLGLIPYYIDKTNMYIEQYKNHKNILKDFEFKENVIMIKPQTMSRFKKKNETFD